MKSLDREVDSETSTVTRHAIITVKSEVQEADLHEDDLAVAGVYGVAMGEGDGEHPLEPRDPDSVDAAEGPDGILTEAAKDVFHDHVGIHVLDDFDIVVEILTEGADAPSERDGHDIHWL